MDIKEYCDSRRLEMVKESQEIGKQRETLLQQGRQIEARVNQINQTIMRLDVELELMAKIETSLNGKEEVEC